MDEAGFLRQHAEVLFLVDAAGRIVELNEPEGDPPPRLFLARGRASDLLLLRADVPDVTARRCAAAARALDPWDGERSRPPAFDPLRAALAADAPVAAESIGPAFRFGTAGGEAPSVPVLRIDASRAGLLARHFPFTAAHLDRRDPVVGAVADGAVVSACYAARKSATACEAGVDTVEAYRGRGLAVAVVSAWRVAVEEAGSVPLYSTTWDNAASLAVAARLGLACYAETLTIA